MAALPKMAPGLLQEDLSLLQKILQANHPSLYWYTPKDSLDNYFSQAISGISDSMDEVAFKNKVASVISRIRCGHTTVRFSKAYSKKASLFRFPQFPLALKAWDDSLVVLGSITPGDSIFKRGTVITGINGKSNRQLLDTLFGFISTDGYSDNYKDQVISGNFAAWYKTILGLDSVYTINYIDSTGHPASTQIRNFSPRIDLTRRQNRSLPAVQKPTRRQLRQAGLLEKRAMWIDTASSTAFIRLTTFSGGGLRGFFRRSFRSLREQNIKHLVLDLRENGGGKVRSSILLAKYLADHRFKIGDTVAAISRQFEYGRYIKPVLVYWFAMNFGAHRMDDGRIHIRYYENHYFDPKKQNHFNGDIYLLQGGYTFSASTMFLSWLQHQKNVTTIGEETGGGYYGNSAMHIPTITLPNSKLQISLPMYRLVMDTSRPKGHGFIPDITVKPSSWAIRNGVDLKLEKALSLIQQKTP
ncbi:MAG: peptidase S41 [Chitinophagaceae bacterium]|nr:peptidase S41 [Chitinophagaceae bacterium]